MSRMRWIFVTLTISAVAGACGGGDAAPPTAPPPPPPAPTVSLSGTSFEVRGIGDSLLVSSTATPSGATVTWSITSPAVATVGARGSSALLTAVGGGTTTLTVEASSGSQRASATATVTVVPIVRSVRLDPTGARLLVGATRQLSVVVQKDAGANDAVRWTSRTPQSATVSASGLVTGVSAGAAVIVTESVVDVSRRDSVTLQVDVPVVGAVTISPTTDTLLVGAFRDFVASVTADSGLSTAVTWTTSAPAIASVNASGRVTAVAAGSVIISARSVADPSRVANATLVVRAPAVRTVRVVGTTPLTAGAQSQYTTDIVADPGVSTAVTWSSSQPGVASVNNTGQVTAIGAGITKIISRSVSTPAVADSLILTVTGPPRFAAWETRQLGVVGGQLEVGAPVAIVSLDTTGFMASYGTSFWARAFLWRGDLTTIAPSGVVTTSVYDLSIASDGHVTGWQQQSPRTAYRWNGSSFVALPALPDGAVIQAAPTALPNGRVGAHGRGGGFDRAYVWTGAQWQERFRIAPNITSGLFSHVVFFSETDILYYEPNTGANPRIHRLLRWTGGNNFDALPSMTVEGSFFFIPEFVGRSSFDFYVKLTNSRPLRRFIEGGWIELTLGMAADERVTELTMCPTRPVVATSAERVLAVDVAVGVPLGTAADFTQQDTWHIACAPDGSLRRVGNNGYVGRWTGTTWRTELQAYPITAVRAVSSTLAYAGTRDGVIHRWNGVVWSEVFRPAPGSEVGAVSSIAAWPDGRVVATAARITASGSGNSGELRLTTSGGSWTVTLNSTGVGALWGLSADEVWGLTTPGHIYRSRNGGAFEVMRSDQRYVGLGGRAGSNMIAIGSKLETLRWTGTAWEQVTAAVPGVQFASIPAIWSETDAWVAASTAQDNWANVIHRFNGTTWQPVDMGPLGGSGNSMATHALFTPGPGEVYALHSAYQSTTTSLFHRIDGAWTTIRPLLTRYPVEQFVLSDAAPGIALVVDDFSRLHVSRPGLTGATNGLMSPVRRKR